MTAGPKDARPPRGALICPTNPTHGVLGGVTAEGRLRCRHQTHDGNKHVAPTRSVFTLDEVEAASVARLAS